MNKYNQNKITALSFFLMIMIVNIHCYNLRPSFTKGFNTFVQDLFSQGLSRVAVPLFFLISGYLFFFNIKEGLFKEFWLKIKSRCKTLVIPYLFWTISSCLLYFFLQSIPRIGLYFGKEIVANYSLQDWLHRIFISPIAYQFWFIRDLFIFVLFTPLLYRLIKYFHYYFLLILIITWFLNFSFYLLSIQPLFFFSFGAFLSIKKIEINNFKLNKYDLMFLFLWLSFVFLHRIIIFNNILISDFFIKSIYKIGILFGILSVWLIYDRIIKNEDISKIEIFPLFTFSFFIFAFHQPFGTLLEYSFYFIFGKTQLSSFILYLICPFIIIVVSIVCGQFMKKKIPSFYFLITGGR